MIESHNQISVFIRADASISIGTGHIIRCLTLADELNRKRVNVNFICRKEPGNLIGLIQNKGYAVYDLPADIDINVDIDLSRKILKNQPAKAKWLIVDNYSLDKCFETQMKPYVKQIMVIDDIADRPHDCDLLLNQNLCVDIETHYDRLVSSCCLNLLGPQYALLRPEFSDFRRNRIERNSSVKRILIFMGGTDPTNETYKALKAVKLLKMVEVTFDVIVGVSNPHKEEIRQQCSEMPNIRYYCQVENMAQLMSEADVAVGAGGSTAWERCCLGLPSIVLILSDNQMNIAKILEEKGIIINLGWHRDITEYHIKDAIEGLICHADKRGIMEMKGMELVDGKGTERVVREILKYRNA